MPSAGQEPTAVVHLGSLDDTGHLDTSAIDSTLVHAATVS